ncbi:MAG: cupredoxin domain-containing protein [Gammaproteobacteria bacterium]|nr:cupredoxin domain-containing protein [Gammaproteobacteria bacterium]
MSFIHARTQAQGSDGIPTIDLRIRNHLFIPAQLTVPANTRFRLRVINEDKTPEEFESAALNREKVIMGESEGVIFLGPLPVGEYSFFGEFNPRTAQGRLIAASLQGSESHD